MTLRPRAVRAATWAAAAALLGVSGTGQVAGANHECAVPVCTPGEETPLVYDSGRQVFNVKHDFLGPGLGAKGDATNDDRDAILAADAAAAASGNGIVWFPAGTYKFSGTLRATTTWAGSGSAGSNLLAAATTDGPVLVLGPATPGPASAHRAISLRDIRLQAPGTPYKVTDAAWSKQVDGIRIDGPYRLESVSVIGFDKGFTLNSPSGRITLSGVRAAGNYYATYHRAGGDNLITGGSLTGNFASVASSPDQAIKKLTIQRTHLGFGPYGFYEEAGTPGPDGWLDDVHLTMARFEFVGNAMFRSVNCKAGGGNVRDLRITWPGYSKGRADLEVKAGQPVDQEMCFGKAEGRMLFHDTYQGGDSARPLARVYIHDNQATWEWLRREWLGGPTLTVNSGRTDTFDIRSLDLALRRGQASIPANATSVTVTLPHYLGPPESLFPLVQATSSGGLTTRHELVVTNITSPTTADGTSFVVSLVGVPPGFTRTVPLTFLWKLDQDAFLGNTHS